ncbi:MAG: aminotransferase class III-fold pyridoxal phosphate-dependent enzyme, partial [Sedimentisphaerales bacterium]|nr:aminotransferase class III-fold pyridoxal phosphate-dependent enzyme [Sedimentisphaerales bacterium]
MSNKELYTKAVKIIPGGVNSPVRAFKSVGCEPVFIRSASGSKVTDENGKTYIDYIGSWGPMLVGHAHPSVTAAICQAAANGTSFGAATAAEVTLAERVISFFPSIEMLRMVNSGTEATMSALRLARAFTRRDKFIKFAGCYHGHADSFLVSAGSGALTLGLPDSPGVTAGAAADTLIAQFNDINSVASLIKAHPGEIAAVIVEPVVGNAGLILPVDNFLSKLRELTAANNILLICDEVMTG